MTQTQQSLCPLYERLHEKYSQIKYKEYDMMSESAKINTVLRKLELEPRKQIGEAIYALILHHELKKGNLRGEIAMGATLLPFSGGVQYTLTNLPPVLQQMIIIFFNELINGTCPESIQPLG